MKQRLAAALFLAAALYLLSGERQPARAQPVLESQVTDLEQRVTALEQFAENLSEVVEHQVKFASQRVIRLSIVNKNYQSILTNSGVFLVAVDELARAKDGYILKLRIGNLSSINYQGFNVRLRWGINLDPKSSLPFKEWRGSLKEAEFAFQGNLEQAHWTPINLALGNIDREKLAYIEMELDVSAVEMTK